MEVDGDIIAPTLGTVFLSCLLRMLLRGRSGPSKFHIFIEISGDFNWIESETGVSRSVELFLEMLIPGWMRSWSLTKEHFHLSLNFPAFVIVYRF